MTLINMNLFEINKAISDVIEKGFYEDSVNILNEDLISNDFKKRKETWSINKTAIKAAISNGKKVDGAELVENTNLTLK